MRVLYFQPFSGASGDMMLGALLDLGVPLELLREGLSTLGLPGWSLEAQTVRRGAFRATRALVRIDPEKESPAHRHLDDIVEAIRGSALPLPVKEAASRVFRRLAEAEARVHGISPEEVHFHEIGAVDSIIDIVGCCLGVHLLGVEEIVSAPPVLGTGFAETAHGPLALPAPATLELLKGFPVEHRDSGFELTTPTGAALLSSLASHFGTMPPLTIREIGYGAGSDRPDPIPNVLRAVLGEARATSSAESSSATGRLAPGVEAIVLLETNVDDMSPQLLGHVLDKLLEAGALDASVVPILMKKSRPAHQIQVLATAESEPALVELLFRETTTLGVRRRVLERYVLARESRALDTPWGPVRAKLGFLGPDLVTCAPEYEDAREIARRHGVPLKEVYRVVSELAAKAAAGRGSSPEALSSEAPPGAS